MMEYTYYKTKLSGYEHDIKQSSKIKGRSPSLTMIYFLAILLCCTVVTTEAAGFSQRFWIRVSRCKGIMKLRCAYMSNYCNPRVLKRRSVESQEQGQSEILHVIEKRSSRRFHVSCRACNRFCW